MAKRRPIQEQWMTFKAAVMHVNAPKEQVEDMKMAFYGGAKSFQSAMFASLSKGNGEEITEADVKFMELVDDDLNEFVSETTAMAIIRDLNKK